MPLKVLAIAGTRPEAIKLAPVVRALRARPHEFSAHICLTGQHRELADNVLPLFGLLADENLPVMTPGQTLCEATAKILSGLDGVLRRFQPDVVLVQGDTTSTFCGAVAAFYSGIAVAHVEAGLRTGNAGNPFPEEMNRRLVTQLAGFHFAATRRAAANLYAEGVPCSRIWTTGNSGIDAALWTAEQIVSGNIAARLPVCIDPSRKLLLVTAHRRENLAQGLGQIALALRRLAERDDVQIVFPVHSNPQVRLAVDSVLSGQPHIHLIDPLPYPEFLALLRHAYLVLSDSGGIQEEAPVFGRPVLILRDTTERPEAVDAGANRLIGTSADAIVKHASELLDDVSAYRAMARPRPVYGDGRASERICNALLAGANPIDDIALLRERQAA